jgi:hypothetical protein
MKNDISSLLAAWPYDEDASVRRITGTDGREKLQVRLPLGIEQYEVHGRPDGVRPEGCESYLEHYERVAEREGGAWRLTAEDFSRLHEEGMLYYFRYLLFFRIGEYDLCARDTARNLRLADFVSRHADGSDMAQTLEQYRPYIIRMHAVAEAVKTAKKGELARALTMITDAIREIEALGFVETQVFRLEKARSLVALRDLKSQLTRQDRASTPLVQRLREDLAEAVSHEDYERAAVIRDKLKRLEGGDVSLEPADGDVSA